MTLKHYGNQRFGFAAPHFAHSLRYSVMPELLLCSPDALSLIRTQEERARTLGVRPASEITTEALLERYKRHQKARIRPTTYQRLGGILATLQAHLPQQAKAITKRTIADYIETRADTVKPGTVAKEMSVLKHCLKLAVEWGELHQNPAAGARLPKLPPGKTRYLTPGELRAALESAPEWMRAPMAFAVCTGVRRGEMLSLRWMDVDMEHRRLYLRETKNGALRVLPLSVAALQVLGSLHPGAAGDPVFAGVDAANLSVYTKRVFKRLGIPDASFHTLRHTVASWLVQQGVDPERTLGTEEKRDQEAPEPAVAIQKWMDSFKLNMDQSGFDEQRKS